MPTGPEDGAGSLDPEHCRVGECQQPSGKVNSGLSVFNWIGLMRLGKSGLVVRYPITAPSLMIRGGALANSLDDDQGDQGLPKTQSGFQTESSWFWPPCAPNSLKIELPECSLLMLPR